MKKIVKITATALLLTMVSVGAQEKLERGEDRIDTPAIRDGLCVSNVFQSNMVIQRGKPIAVWGWAAPGEEVAVAFGGQRGETITADDRSWKVTLPPMTANAEPQRMIVKGKTDTVSLDNILIGDVWVTGGQSNMEFEIAKVVDGDLEIASANFPKIRLLTVPQLDGPDDKKAFPRLYQWNSWFNRHFRQGYWDVCTPDNVRLMTAIGYIFARRVHLAAQIPIGVIDVSRGGTALETWTPDSVLRAMDTPEVKTMLAEWDRKVAEYSPEASLAERVRNYNERTERLRSQGEDVSGRTPPTEPGPSPAINMNRPGNCYASMLAPLTGLSVKGVIWHQGFNNAMQPNGHAMYYQVFPKMIEAWRGAFGDPDMPFGIISLCTAGEPQDMDNYVSAMCDEGIHIREVQYKTFLDMMKAGDKNIGFASSFDQRRSWFHPQIKVPVGERAARWALATQYGTRLQWEPPAIKEVTAGNGVITLKMTTHVGPHNDGPILGFAIAGEDGRFQPAAADYLVTGKDDRGRPKRDRGVIVLSSPLVPEPVYFRYAWGRNPLANVKANGIPLATQRNDHWTLADMYKNYTGDAPTAAPALSREERNKLLKALRAADLERRLFEADKLIKANIQP
ncbi:MAG: sialate O-acetylesterase [Lentisphaeria bacterium]|nr:sialate O-acetylesterase [Lentisphaeria bacterium]